MSEQSVSDRLSKISTASTAVFSRRIVVASHASVMSGKIMNADA